MRALSFAAALLVPVTLAAQQPTVVTIDSGMTKADVIAKLGAPLSSRTRGTTTFLSYPNGCEKTCGMSDLVILENDRVIDAIFRSPAHQYSGKSSSPRMISRDSAQKIAVSKGDTSTPPKATGAPAPSDSSKTRSALQIKPPAVDTAKKVAQTPAPQKAVAPAPQKAAAAPPTKAPASVAQSGRAATSATAPAPTPPTKAAPAPNRSTGAPATKAPPFVPHRMPVATQPATSPASFLPADTLTLGIYLALSALFLFLVVGGMWRVFEKAGQPGWAALIPVYNLVVTLDVAGKPIWWLLLLLVPVVNLLVWILVMVEIAKRFSKGPLFGLGLTFLSIVFFPLLGFGDAEYAG